MIKKHIAKASVAFITINKDLEQTVVLILIAQDKVKMVNVNSVIYTRKKIKAYAKNLTKKSALKTSNVLILIDQKSLKINT